MKNACNAYLSESKEEKKNFEFEFHHIWQRGKSIFSCDLLRYDISCINFTFELEGKCAIYPFVFWAHVNFGKLFEKFYSNKFELSCRNSFAGEREKEWKSERKERDHFQN